MEEDLDGDGRVLLMRLQDPNGTWKVAADDPRLMVARDPFDDAGRGPVLPGAAEGRLQN